MRFKVLAALAALAASSLVAVLPADAGGGVNRERGWSYAPAYYPVKKKRVYYGKRPVVGAYIVTDPYAYRYEPRGYYPYYDAGYWRPACVNRLVCVPTEFQSPYWKAWGYPKPWVNRDFHAVYHGRIRPWHW